MPCEDIPDLIEEKGLKQDVKVLGKQKVQEFITVFEHSSAAEWANILNAVQEREQEKVASIAHKLKGSASSMGLIALRKELEQIEISDQPIERFEASRGDLKSILSKSLEALKALDL